MNWYKRRHLKRGLCDAILLQFLWSRNPLKCLVRPLNRGELHKKCQFTFQFKKEGNVKNMSLNNWIDLWWSISRDYLFKCNPISKWIKLLRITNVLLRYWRIMKLCHSNYIKYLYSISEHFALILQISIYSLDFIYDKKKHYFIKKTVLQSEVWSMHLHTSNFWSLSSDWLLYDPPYTSIFRYTNISQFLPSRL